MSKIEFTLKDKKNLAKNVAALRYLSSKLEDSDEFEKSLKAIRLQVQLAKSQLRASNLGWRLISTQVEG
ncbi:MAG: hypothetical protein JNM93_06885 [Bacteriovoracaceae bacterium]|nr:hypothetical protein [Bacteriovoracaceae bacterium]